ncbi:uncharacterized protein LOC144421076 [Styela clava]
MNHPQADVTSSMTSTTTSRLEWTISPTRDLPFIILATVFATVAIITSIIVCYVIRQRGKRKRKYLRQKQNSIPNDYVTARELGIIHLPQDDDSRSQQSVASPPLPERIDIRTISAQVTSDTSLDFSYHDDWSNSSSDENMNQSHSLPRGFRPTVCRRLDDWSNLNSNNQSESSPALLTMTDFEVLHHNQPRNLSVVTSHSENNLFLKSQKLCTVTEHSSSFSRSNDSTMSQQCEDEPIYCSIEDL